MQFTIRKKLTLSFLAVGVTVLLTAIATWIESVKETSEIIAQLAKNTEAGVTLVHKVGTSLERIVDGTNRVHELVVQITNASVDQNSDIDEIRTSLRNLADVTQDTAGSVQELAATSRDSRTQIKDLKKHLGAFRTSRS